MALHKLYNTFASTSTFPCPCNSSHTVTNTRYQLNKPMDASENYETV